MRIVNRQVMIGAAPPVSARIEVRAPVMGAARRPGEDREESLASLPCAVCGSPSAGWVYTSETDEQGRDMIAAYSACAAHRLEVVQKADTQAS